MMKLRTMKKAQYATKKYPAYFASFASLVQEYIFSEYERSIIPKVHKSRMSQIWIKKQLNMQMRFLAMSAPLYPEPSKNHSRSLSKNIGGGYCSG